MRIPTLVNSWYIKNADGTDRYFEYPRGTHVMVLIGHDSSKVYMNDPYLSGVKSYPLATFADRWNLLGKQAIIIEDYKVETTKPESTETQTTESTETSKDDLTKDTNKSTTDGEETKVSTTKVKS